MLHLVNLHCYSTEDWRLMQRALAKAFEVLQRCPKSHANADRLARTVMKLFDQGLRDEEAIVSKAVKQEELVSGIGQRRENNIAS